MDTGHIVTVAVGLIFIIFYMLFLADMRLSDAEWKFYTIITGRQPVEEDPGVPWGIWVLLIGAVLVVIGMWPLLGL